MGIVVGQVLRERYRIEALLGRGGMGAVYRATDLTFGSPVAVKENLQATGEAQRQFSREAVLLHQLRHPNLPRVTDHFALPGLGQYLVMDYVEGQDLREILEQQGAQPVAQALAWIGPVLDALAYLHSQKIIHRDVKPANIKITPRGDVFLVDFGLAKMHDPLEETTMGARGVTPGFAPPEQYGQARTDARSDIYSAGATLYALLTGQTPPDALAFILGQGQLVPPRQLNPQIPAAVERAVLRAMQIRPDDRFQTAPELRAALAKGPARAGLQGPDLAAMVSAPMPREARPPQARPPAPSPEVPPTATKPGAIPAKALAGERGPASREPTGAATKLRTSLESAWGPASALIARFRAQPLALVLLAAILVVAGGLAVLWAVAGDGSRHAAAAATPYTPQATDVAGVPAGTRAGTANQLDGLLFTSTRDGHREVYRFNEGREERLTNSPQGESWGAVETPEGLYFTSTRGGKREIYRLLEYRTEQMTFTTEGESWGPVLTSEGLYFTSTRDGQREIYRRHEDRTERMTFTEGGESWGPVLTGEGLYFTSTRDGHPEIYRLRGNRTERMTSTMEGGSWGPALTDEGLYFTSDRSGRAEIYRLNDREMQQMTVSEPGESWGPVFWNGLVFTSTRDGRGSNGPGPREIYWLHGTTLEQVTRTPNGGESWVGEYEDR